MAPGQIWSMGSRIMKGPSVGWRGCASTCASTRSVRVKVLVDELRRELAQRYLEQGVHRPKSIAALLGYKDLS